jgi:pimeloyl-ACP methyl ester carboxylesterase
MPQETIHATSLHFAQRGEGLPVVLLHGFPLDHRVWSDQFDRLSSMCRVICPDLRGFGKSAGGGSFSIESLAEDIHELLRRIDALPCVLGGLSMGGYVSFAFAKKYAADLNGLILIDTRAAADTHEGRQARDAMIELARTRGSAAVAEQMLPKMLAPGAQVAERLRAIMKDCPAQTIQYACAAMRDRQDYTSLLPSIAVRTLLIFGELDQIIPAQTGQMLGQLIPNSRLDVIAGAGHTSPMEKPDHVSSAIAGFLRDL